MKTKNSKTNEPRKFVLNLSCCSSKNIYLLHVEKYKTTV